MYFNILLLINDKWDYELQNKKKESDTNGID